MTATRSNRFLVIRLNFILEVVGYGVIVSIEEVFYTCHCIGKLHASHK